MPTTAVPGLGTFIETYENVAKQANEILVLAISHKLSGTYETACRAAEMVKTRCRIEVIDTMHVVMAEGLIVIQAAKAAQAGAGIDEIIKQVQNNIPRVEERMAFDTLEYLETWGADRLCSGLFGLNLKTESRVAVKRR